MDTLYISLYCIKFRMLEVRDNEIAHCANCLVELRICAYLRKRLLTLPLHLPSLHCTLIVFALDWESHKSLNHERECLTELLERACFQPHAIQRIQLAEVGWESDNKGFKRKRVWVVCIKFCATFSVFV